MRIPRVAAGLAAVLVAVAALVATGARPAAAQPKEKSLYERLGGYDAIAAVTDDFIGRLMADASTGRFFTGHSTDSKMRIRQHVVEFLCKATGGPCVYNGRPMKVSHEGLGITEADWDASVKMLVATIDKFKVPEKEKGEVLAAVSSLKADIVAPAKK